MADHLVEWIPNHLEHARVGLNAFRDFGAFLDAVEAPSAVRHADRSSREPGSSFSGTETWALAMEYARHGWKEGRERIQKISAQIAPVVGSFIKAQAYVHDVAGEYLDVGAFTSGEPECMIRIEEETRKAPGKIVKLGANIAMLGGVRPEEAARRGAALMALVEGLELGGMIAELEMVAASNGTARSEWLHLVRCPVKVPGELLDMDRLAFIFCNAAAFRRQVFSLREVQGSEFLAGWGIPSGGYGRTCHHLPKMEEFDLFLQAIRGGEPQWRSDEAAIAWVLDRLMEQGVAMDEEAVAAFKAGRGAL